MPIPVVSQIDAYTRWYPKEMPIPGGVPKRCLYQVVSQRDAYTSGVPNRCLYQVVSQIDAYTRWCHKEMPMPGGVPKRCLYQWCPKEMPIPGGVPKRCLYQVVSQRDAYTRWCPKEMPILSGVFLLLLAPLPYPTLVPASLPLHRGIFMQSPVGKFLVRHLIIQIILKLTYIFKMKATYCWLFTKL